MNIPSILIIEDEKILANNIRRYLEKLNYFVEVSECGNDAINQLIVATPDLVLLDLKLPDMDGLEILSRIRKFEPNIKVVMMTAFGDVETAVMAMKDGASDFLTKPLKLASLKELLERVLRCPSHRPKTNAIQRDTPEFLDKLVGEDSSMLKVKQKISQLLRTETSDSLTPPPLLVTGDTGTGKELVARALHFEGNRVQAPFLQLSASTITPDVLSLKKPFNHQNLLESSNKDILSAVNGGTLFIDEIADAGLEVQAQLVDLISDRDTNGLGRSSDRDSDVWFVASTSQSLESLVQMGQFRSDLYFRLSVFNIHLPPLCKRNNDILRLADHFLSVFTQRYRKPLLRLDPEAKTSLKSYHWPGNVRELKNIMEQAVLTVESDSIGANDLNIRAAASNTPDFVRSNNLNVSYRKSPSCQPIKGETERDTLIVTLDRTEWNISQTAKILEISPNSVRYRIKKYDLKSPKIR